MLPHGSYCRGDTVVETRLYYAVPRAATLQDARCEAVATFHVTGPATPTPPFNLSRNQSPSTGAAPSAAQEDGTTGSAHSAPGRPALRRSCSRRDASSATLDAEGTRAYHEKEPSTASWIAASPRMRQLGKLGSGSTP